MKTFVVGFAILATACSAGSSEETKSSKQELCRIGFCEPEPDDPPVLDPGDPAPVCYYRADATLMPSAWANLGCKNSFFYVHDNTIAGAGQWVGALCPETNAVRTYVAQPAQKNRQFVYTDSASNACLSKPPAGWAYFLRLLNGPQCTSGCSQPFPDGWQ
jgi:hypothetical protein